MAQDKKKPNTTKRIPKTGVKFKVALNDEQKEAKRLILENDIIVLFGKAGSGKTLVSCQAALDFYFTRKIETIRIARPTVAKEELGFLPGKIEEKLEPWLQPIYHNFYQCYDKKKIEEMLKEENIIISPLAYMRGITYLNEAVIVDEAQNITVEQMKMIVTRLGKNSKLIFCGDEAQVDLKRNSDSGLSYLLEAGKNVKGFIAMELQTNHRHEIVDRFLDQFKILDDSLKQK